MPTLSTVLLTIKGEARKANLQVTDELTIDIIQKYFKKKDEPEQICYYEKDDKYIFIFGYKKGKKGTENKTELPDISTTIYGDAIVIVSSDSDWSHPIPFTVEEWNILHNDEDEETHADEPVTLNNINEREPLEELLA